MPDPALLAAIVGAAGLVACLGTRALIPLLRRAGVLDRPNARSSHAAPTPRGGGIAPLGAMLLTWLALILAGAVAPRLLIILFGAALLAGISWIDDLRGLSPLTRLAAQLVAVGLGIFALLPAGPVFQGGLMPWLDAAAAGLLWLWFVNLFNFMDGIDGLAGSEAAAIAIGLMLFALFGAGRDPGLAALAGTTAAAALGFLVWNWAPAKIFLGDVGSVPLGYLLGYLLLDVAARGGWKIALILPLYFLADATLTLARRLLRGEPVWQAHRQHFYQRAAQRGLGHAAIVRRVIAADLILIACGWAAENGWGLSALAAAAMVVAALLASLARGWQPQTGLRLAASRRPSYTRPVMLAARRAGMACRVATDPPRADLGQRQGRGSYRLHASLATRGVALVSTGGSAKTLAAAGLPVTEVAALTGFPEILDGRVKTLHPAIHGGLLARRDRPDHLATLAAHGIAEIDLLVCNLYPFAATVAAGAGYEECIENIDIGGVALIRAAAKNHDFVTVVTDPADYASLLDEMTNSGGVGLAMRRRLAQKAYALTAAYDAAIAAWFAGEEGIAFPETLVVAGRLATETRYGENPHQRAALYRTDEHAPRGRERAAGAGQGAVLQQLRRHRRRLRTGRRIWPRRRSRSSSTPTRAAPRSARICARPGTRRWRATGSAPLAASSRSTAGSMRRPPRRSPQIFVEVVIAPDAEPAAGEILARRSTLRLLLTGGLPDPRAPGWTYRSVAGGLLVQERDRVSAGPRR